MNRVIEQIDIIKQRLSYVPGYLMPGLHAETTVSTETYNMFHVLKYHCLRLNPEEKNYIFLHLGQCPSQFNRLSLPMKIFLTELFSEIKRMKQSVTKTVTN